MNLYQSITNFITTKRNFLVIFFTIIAVILSFYTYLEISLNKADSLPNPKIIMYLILGDLVCILVIAIIILQELLRIWKYNKNIIKGSRLQTKIIFAFSLIASIPTIIIAFFSILFFYYGIQTWFNERINTALTESLAVAKAYLNEHQKLIESDAAGVATNLNYLIMNTDFNHQNFDSYLSKQAHDRTFLEAIIFKEKPFTIIAQSSFSLPFRVNQKINQAIENAKKNNIVIIGDVDKFTALVKLDNFSEDTFLLVSRLIDSRVIEHVKKTNEVFSEYQKLNANIAEMQIEFSAVFLIFSILLILSAIWTGIRFAGKIVAPLFLLVNATENLKEGNFSVRVIEGPDNDEIGVLSRAFNLMAAQLDLQRSGLIEASKQIDARRHFSETVISGVSAGIIALDISSNISMINPQAQEILEKTSEEAIGKEFYNICPEMNELLERLKSQGDDLINGQIKLYFEKKSKVLFVRIIAEIINTEALGYIITFDDITQLINAQMRSAWSDVARRIAHEIKNPLTPIQLAAQRLQKKYANLLEDSVTFTKYTETIIKHVSQIGRMVEEFVYFAKMPLPKITRVSLNKVIQDTVFSRECLENNINYEVTITEDEIEIAADSEQISQALANIFKNSEESFLQAELKTRSKTIKVDLSKTNNYATILITDNGPGFPARILDKITEPYVTNKPTGTGLGLSIVKKIIDDHNAIIEFSNNLDGGAEVKIIFEGHSKN